MRIFIGLIGLVGLLLIPAFFLPTNLLGNILLAISGVFLLSAIYTWNSGINTRNALVLVGMMVPVLIFDLLHFSIYYQMGSVMLITFFLYIIPVTRRWVW